MGQMRYLSLNLISIFKALRPKGRSFPAWYFLYIVPLDPALKAGIAGYSPFSKPLDPIMRGAQFRRKIKRAVSELDSSKFHTGVGENQRKDESSNISHFRNCVEVMQIWWRFLSESPEADGNG
jgi:hypothetical protein